MRNLLKEFTEQHRDEIFAALAALFLVLSFCIISILYGCGGGGAGGATVSSGMPESAVNITLHSSKVVETAGNSVSLYASVYDGNGRPVENKTVSFAVTAGHASVSAPTAVTDSKGIASVSLKLEHPSVVVVSARTDSQTSVRTLYSVSSSNPSPAVHIEMDGDNDSIYSEQGDFSVTADGRDTVNVRVRFLNVAGIPEAGHIIRFGADTGRIRRQG